MVRSSQGDRLAVTCLGQGIGISLLVGLVGWSPEAARSQIVPDTTLSTPSQITQTGNIVTITGGTLRGSNLFHSFREFSILTNGVALFDNGTRIQTIVARVTGNQASSIDGVLRTNQAHLFLINPKGIVFGRNAQLQVGGSFMASTVQSLQFPDGSRYSASQPQDAPLLAIALTPGLQYGQGRPQAPITQTGFLVARQDLGLQASRLEIQGAVQAGGNVSLVAADRLRLQGASVSAVPGSNRTIALTAPTVELVNSQVISRVDARNPQPGANIQVTANQVTLQTNSVLLTSSAGLGQAGHVQVQVRDRLNLTNNSGVLTVVEPTGQGAGGPVQVQAAKLTATGSSVIASLVLPDATRSNGLPSRQGNGGNLKLTIGDTHLDGYQAPAIQPSGIFSWVQQGGQGNGGQIRLAGDRLAITRGASITTIVEGQGKGGDVALNLKTIHVDGERVVPQTGRSSIQTALNANSTGDGGRIQIQTNRLELTNGGFLASSNFRGQGQAGDLQIQATEYVRLTGRSSFLDPQFNLKQPSEITSYVIDGPVPVTTKGGDIRIQTRDLILEPQTGVNTTTDAVGRAGDIDITSRTMTLRGFLGSTTTDVGASGHVTLRATDQVTIAGSGRPNATYTTLAAASTRGTVDFSPVVQFSPGQDPLRQQGAVFELLTGERKFVSAYDLVVAARQQASLYSVSLGLGETGDLRITAPSIAVTNYALLGVLQPALVRPGTLRLEGQTIQIANSYLLSSPIAGQVRVGSTSAATQNNLEIVADRLTLDGSTLLAVSSLTSGPRDQAVSAGNIYLQVRDLLLLRHGSQITARAFGVANGGNLTIDAGLIVAVPPENSDLVANAFRGNGGTIRIATQGIFGLAYRPLLTPWSDINASSDFGLDGTLILTTPNLDPSQGLVQLSTELVEPTHQILQTCSPLARVDRFVVTGRGGLPPSAPIDLLSLPSPWADSRPISGQFEPPSLTPAAQRQTVPSHSARSSEIIEATAWQKAADGSIHLVAGTPQMQSFPNSTCQTGWP